MSIPPSEPSPHTPPDRTSQSELSRISRFLAVGLLNTAFGYSVFAAVWFFTQSSIAGIVAGNVLGPIFNYFTIGRLVFANRDHRTVWLFLVGYALVLAINLLSVKWLEALGVHPLVAQLISIPMLIAFSYLFNSRVVFRRQTAPSR